MTRSLDRDASALARELAELGSDQKSKVFRMSWWSERMLDWAMSRPAFKTQLFRFVDVFPALEDDADVSRHLGEYFDGVAIPKLFDLGVEMAPHVPFGRSLEARVARRNIKRMAEQFIVGETPAEAVQGLHLLWRTGSAATVDLLGEKTIVAAEADRYAARVAELLTVLSDASEHWAPDDHSERDDVGPIPRVNVSIKPTALASQYDPLGREIGIEQAKHRIRPLLQLARDRGAFVHFDMEHYSAKGLTLQLFRELLSEPDFADLESGIVVQAYLKDSRDDLAGLIAWSAQRSRPITVRLVKGAYWDTETVEAQAEGWPVPVFERKEETDANYERCVRLLHDHHGEVRAAFGTHNLRSLAYAVTYARSKGIPDTGFEVQMLYGMAEPMQAAVKRKGCGCGCTRRSVRSCRAWRTSCAGCSRTRATRASCGTGSPKAALDELLTPPDVDHLPTLEPRVPAATTDPSSPTPYEPEPVAEWRHESVRARFAAAIDRAAASDIIDVPALIAGDIVRTPATIDSVDPADVALVVARSASCTAQHADSAIAAALAAADDWRRTPTIERAGVLFRAAAWMRNRRVDIAALEVFEAGKPWDQADADVCEAIDFCEYYGREMLRLDASSADRVQSPPGERNRLVYQGKGVAVVIAPWNFPLAIPTGMTVGALVAGNPVILKPAEQTPATAWQLIEALQAGGAPPGTVQFLPGLGEDVGARLVEHPDVAIIVFTGSKAVGLHINETAAVHRPGQRHVKRVVAEMGGKNAIIVDSDADPDQAVPAVINSAFGFAGQKCSAASRVIVTDRIYDSFVARLVAATREVVVDHPRRMAARVGPVIDADSHARLMAAIEQAGREARILVQRDDVPTTGWFVGPTLVEVDDPALVSVARDELFGPVVAIMRAMDFDHAIELANATDYALTAGIFSRSPAHIARAANEMRAGNLYINRAITGAVVGRQPFGGYGLSGVGSKAGGPDYLLQFLDPRTITENTVRQGFAAEE